MAPEQHLHLAWFPLRYLGWSAVKHQRDEAAELCLERGQTVLRDTGDSHFESRRYSRASLPCTWRASDTIHSPVPAVVAHAKFALVKVIAESDPERARPLAGEAVEVAQTLQEVDARAHVEQATASRDSFAPPSQ